MNEERRLLIDMDGTLAKFSQVSAIEMLYEKGYFRKLEPLPNVVKAVQYIIRTHPKLPVYVMSAVLSDSSYALQEKNEWLNEHLPEIDVEHRIFSPCGENKLDYVPDGIRENDYLLDDYTANLTLWEPPARGIKLLNGINHTRGTWSGCMLRYDKSPQELGENILDIMNGAVIQDERPISQVVEQSNREYDSIRKTNYMEDDHIDYLTFITERQGQAALDIGVHIVCMNEYPEYQGIHDGSYLIQEVCDKQELARLYGSKGRGIVHQAFISPYYEDAGQLRSILQRECAEHLTVARKKTEKKQNLKRKELRL